jgi:hypothetical protein
MKPSNSRRKAALASAVVLVTSFSIHAEITEQSNSSFTVKHSFISNKNVSTAIHEFGHVGRWWTSEFTQSGNGRNMFFNSFGMYENMPNGEVITHLTKVEKENNQWVWVGGLGNLGNENVDAKMKISIKDNHHGTKISMEYSVSGDSIADNKAWPAYTDTMLEAQMKSLKSSLRNR